jgi:hypothetical protein
MNAAPRETTNSISTEISPAMAMAGRPRGSAMSVACEPLMVRTESLCCGVLEERASLTVGYALAVPSRRRTGDAAPSPAPGSAVGGDAAMDRGQHHRTSRGSTNTTP